jgi:hypothetical protein
MESVLITRPGCSFTSATAPPPPPPPPPCCLSGASFAPATASKSGACGGAISAMLRRRFPSNSDTRGDVAPPCDARGDQLTLFLTRMELRRYSLPRFGPCPPPSGLDLPPAPELSRLVLLDLAVRNLTALAVAVQVKFVKANFVKPVFHHFIGSRVETRRLSSCGSAGFANLYSPTWPWMQTCSYPPLLYPPRAPRQPPPRRARPRAWRRR